MSKTQAPDPAREAFEARGQYKSKLLFKRGGSWAAEDVPPGDYVDGGVQRDWLLWQEAWKAATAAIQAPEGALHAFKNFHQRLCERFGYFHDEQDWQRDLCSLEEHIAALAAPAPQAPVATVEDNSQDWAGMDGTTAWHLIERHADNWTDIGKMMGEWLAANQTAPSPAEAHELAPCPFCGEPPTTVERPDNIDGTEFFFAAACYCGGYSACAHKMAVRKTPEEAKAVVVAAWNARAAKPQPKGTEPLPWLATRLWNARELWTCPADIEKMLGAQSPAPAQQGGVDCIGLALDLEARAKTVGSQTTERAMKAAAHGLRLLAASRAPAVQDGETRYPHPDEDDAVTLWAEIHRLRAAVQGPDGFESWQDAATAERVRRVAGMKVMRQALEALETCMGVPHWPSLRPAIDALRSALSQSQAETSKCGCTAYCGQYLLHGSCRAHPAVVTISHVPVQGSGS